MEIRNKKLTTYIKKNREIKKSQEEIEELKPYVQKYLRRCSRLGITFDGVSYVESKTKPKFIEEVLIDWLMEHYPEEVKEVTTLAIDYDKLDKLVLREKINLRNLPPGCIINGKSTSMIRVKSNAKE